MTKHARQLTHEELIALTELSQCRDVFACNRASVILLSTKGKSTSAIADTLGMSRRYVRQVVLLFNMHGMHATQKGKSPGRPRTLSDPQSSALLELIDRQPSDFGIKRKTWTLQSLVNVLHSEGICGVSTSILQRELKRLSVDWTQLKLRGAVRIRGDSPVDGPSPAAALIVRRGLHADRMLRLGEGTLFDEVMKNLQDDYAAISKTHSLHMELAAIYSVKLIGAQANGDWEQAERLDRLMQSHLKELKAARKKQESQQPQKTGDTPAEKAAAIVETLRAEGVSMMDMQEERTKSATTEKDDHWDDVGGG